MPVAIKSAPKKSAGRREANAPCPYCKKRHGDGSPWWNASKGGWSISFIAEKDGRPIQRNRLLSKGWDGHDAAIQEWLKAESNSAPIFTATPTESDKESLTAEIVILLYLDAIKDGNPKTFKNTQGVLSDLVTHPRGIGKHTIRQLRNGVGVQTIKNWLAAHSGWGTSYRAMACRMIKAAFNFAVDQERIDSNPIEKLNRKGKGKASQRDEIRIRQFVYSDLQVETILAQSNPRGRDDNRWGTLFHFLCLTGMRPTEATTLTAKDVHTDSAGNLYLLVHHKNEHKTGNKRKVWLGKEAQTIIREQMERWESGCLFRNNWGLQWQESMLAVNLRRICRTPICAKLGLNEFESGLKTDGTEKRIYNYTIYTTRHYFCHRALTTGINGRILNYGEVASLVGNSAAMVEKVYGKMAHNETFMQSLVG